MKSIKLGLLLLVFTSYAQAQLREKQVHLVYSASLNEKRPIEVSLPEGYRASEEKYGVLYVLDGEYVFDYAVGSVAFLSNDFGYLPPLIIVNVPNIDRERDMTFASSGDDQNFMKFIESELVPFISKTYRVNGFDILYGWSSASNINMQFLAKSPDLFDAHIQSGTGIGDKTEEFLIKHMTEVSYQNSYLYANVEGNGHRVVGLNKYEKTIEAVRPEGLVWKFEIMDSSTHVNVIADGIYRGLQFVYGSYYIPESVVIDGFDKIMDYYKALNKQYGYEVRIPAGAINESAGLLFLNKKAEESIRLLEYGMQMYPTAYDLAGSLAEVYEQIGKREQAAKYYEMAFKNSPIGSYDAMKYRYLQKKAK